MVVVLPRVTHCFYGRMPAHTEQLVTQAHAPLSGQDGTACFPCPLSGVEVLPRQRRRFREHGREPRRVGQHLFCDRAAEAGKFVASTEVGAMVPAAWTDSKVLRPGIVAKLAGSSRSDIELLLSVLLSYLTISGIVCGEAAAGKLFEFGEGQRAGGLVWHWHARNRGMGTANDHKLM